MTYVPRVLRDLVKSDSDLGDLEVLMELVRGAHPSGGMQVASSCVCGRGGGKYQFPACRALQLVVDALNRKGTK